MKILALEKETPGVAGDQFKPHLRAEAARVWELYQAGILREIYFSQDEHTAVLILECADAAEARQVLNSLPLVKEGLISFQVIPLAPYSGLARLFVEG
jgi:muconolactone delta-isomerase